MRASEPVWSAYWQEKLHFLSVHLESLLWEGVQYSHAMAVPRNRGLFQTLKSSRGSGHLLGNVMLWFMKYK